MWVESHESVVVLNPLLGGHAYVTLPPREGMPGLASWQLKPSRLPVPVQLVPHETSFSRSTLTHLLLLQSASLEQKQPPGAVHVPAALLQWPNGHDVNPVAVEFGHPPSGQGTPESPCCVEQAEFEHVWPGAQGAPQAPQLFGSDVMSAHEPLHSVGALAGQLDTQPRTPASPSAQRPASPEQTLSQLPQLEDAVGLTHPPAHESCPAAHPPASTPPSSPGGGLASSPTTGPSVVMST